MLMRRRLAAVAALAALALGVTACGDDDEGDDDRDREEEVASALADVMGRNLHTENGRIASECTATSIVDQLGAEGVVDGGLLTEDLEVPDPPRAFYPRDVAEAVASAYVDCWDVEAQVEDVQAAIPTIPPKKLQAFGDCLRKIPDDVIYDTFLNASMEGGDRAKAESLGTAITNCQGKLG